MRIVHRYIGLSYLSSLLLCLFVLTFVMSIGLLYKAADLVAQGVDAAIIGQVFASGIPSVLSISLPVAVLGSSLLVFGRLSADGEVNALKACGIGLVKIMETPLLLAICLAMVSLYINMEITPHAHLKRRSLTREFSRTAPLELIEPGRMMSLNDSLTILVGERNGKELVNIHMVDRSGERPVIIEAVRGTVEPVQVHDRHRGEVTKLRVFMEDVRIIENTDEGFRNEAKADSYKDDLEIGFQGSKYTKKRADMDFEELWVHMRKSPEQLNPDDIDKGTQEKVQSYLEMHKRVVMAVACIGFVLLGVPLGVKAQRRESWVGAVISLLVLVGFYLLLVIAQSVAKQGFAYAHYLLWLPVVLMLGLGVFFVRRNA